MAQVRAALLEACKAVSVTFPRDSDGRVVSAIKEKEYLEKLERALSPEFQFKISKTRCWHDFTCGGVPFNLKLTDCKTSDNAFNKVSAIYSITGQVPKCKNLNFNKFWKTIKEAPWQDLNGEEYHYLVVNKISAEVLIKSLFDIHTYTPNPSNIMQINWCREFANRDYKPADLTEKKKELLRCIQKSVKESIATRQDFAQADI